jgi:hypothetical protein
MFDEGGFVEVYFWKNKSESEQRVGPTCDMLELLLEIIEALSGCGADVEGPDDW